MVLIFPVALFLVLLGSGLHDDEIYLKEAAIFVGILLAALLLIWLLHWSPMVFVVVTILLDIVLVLKILGGDVQAF